MSGVDPSDSDTGTGAAMLRIEIVYAVPDAYQILELRVPAGSKLGDALQTADLDSIWPEVVWRELGLAVYGRTATLETILHDFDRIELLRPLLIDPKEARRRRAAGGIKD